MTPTSQVTVTVGTQDHPEQIVFSKRPTGHGDILMYVHDKDDRWAEVTLKPAVVRSLAEVLAQDDLIPLMESEDDGSPAVKKVAAFLASVIVTAPVLGLSVRLFVWISGLG